MDPPFAVNSEPMETGSHTACARCLAPLHAGHPPVSCAGCDARYHDACGVEPCVAVCARRLDPNRRTALAIVLPALFAALTYVLGFLQLLRINMEPKTVTIFSAGLIGGPLCGIFAGVLSTVLHQLFNPLGALDLLSCVAQALAWALVGLAGGMSVKCESRTGFGIAGAALTLCYHVITDWAGGITSGVGFTAYFLGGFVPWPFTPVHIATNAVLFAVLLPALLPFARSWRALLR